MSVFAVVLLRGYQWNLPPQSFEFDWSKTPPEPVDGLRATARASSTSSPLSEATAVASPP
jgi:hypothetical protein